MAASREVFANPDLTDPILAYGSGGAQGSPPALSITQYIGFDAQHREDTEFGLGLGTTVSTVVGGQSEASVEHAWRIGSVRLISPHDSSITLSTGLATTTYW
jgi:hypothetical protein